MADESHAAVRRNYNNLILAVLAAIIVAVFVVRGAWQTTDKQTTDNTPAVVAQRAVLLEEDPNDPQGKRSVGSVVWHTEMVSPGEGKPPELAVRADIEIIERNVGITWTLRRENESSSPTSHTIEIIFKLPPDFSSGGIINVSGIWMKQAELAPGTALAGLSTEVTSNYFLIGLSNAPADRDRNIQMLKERPWFDIPITYTDKRRAILTLEKGATGEQTLREAFAAWEIARPGSTATKK